jgi:hypothetical protein
MVQISLQEAQFYRTKAYYTDLETLGILDVNLKMTMVDTLKTLAAGLVVGFTRLIEAPLNQNVAAWLGANHQSTAAYLMTNITGQFDKKMVAAYKKSTTA